MYFSFLSFSSLLTLSQFLLSFSVTPLSPISLECAAKLSTLNFILISPLVFARNDSVPFRLHLPLQRKVKQRLNYILFYTVCSHYTHSLSSPTGTMWQITMQKSQSRGKKKKYKSHSFTSSKTYP